MNQPKWQLLTTAPNVPLAHVIITLLEEQGVTCPIDSGSSLFGEVQPCGVMVGAHDLHRARRILEQPHFTDAELDFLATGHLSCDDAKE